MLPKEQRLLLFFHRLDAEGSAENHDEAMVLLTTTLNFIEDELSGIAYNPEQPGTDGRMYPPDERYRYSKWEYPGVRCYRQRRHATFVADNGAIEIRNRTSSDPGTLAFEKAGKDGRKVSSYDPPQ
jgi:hypothetical protein